MTEITTFPADIIDSMAATSAAVVHSLAGLGVVPAGSVYDDIVASELVSRGHGAERAEFVLPDMVVDLVVNGHIAVLLDAAPALTVSQVHRMCRILHHSPAYEAGMIFVITPDGELLTQSFDL